MLIPSAGRDGPRERGKKTMANTTTRYELLTSLTTGENCLIRVEDEMVVAVLWGLNSERRAMWIRDMESDDAAGYVNLNGHEIDEPVAYDEFSEGMRVLATMGDTE